MDYEDIKAFIEQEQFIESKTFVDKYAIHNLSDKPKEGEIAG